MEKQVFQFLHHKHPSARWVKIENGVDMIIESEGKYLLHVYFVKEVMDFFDTPLQESWKYCSKWIDSLPVEV